MANNRLLLKNPATGHAVAIAKYFPSGGWRPVYEVEWRLQELLDEVNNDIRIERTGSGPTPWVIEYEERDD